MKSFWKLILFIFLITISTQAFAATRLNIMNFYPNPDDGKYFHLLDSRTLYQWQYAAGTSFTFSYKPLKEINSTRKIIDKMIEEHIFAAVGLTDWFEVAIDVPLGIWINFIDPVPVTTPPTQWKFAIGDVRLLMKGQILDRDIYPVGLSIAPFITFPSGKSEYFVGENNISGGADVILDTQLGKYVNLALNAGAEFGEHVYFRNIDRGAVLLRLGLGANIRATDDLSFSAEGYLKSPTNHFFTDRVHTPAEVIGGVHYKIGDTGFMVNVGGGAGIVKGAGAPDVRAFAGLTYKRMTPEFIERDRARLAGELRPEKKVTSDIQKMIVELREKCPPPAQYKEDVHDPACPKYYDLREIADLIIECPENPEHFNELRDDPRCHKVYTLADNYSARERNIAYAMSVVELSLRCPESPDLYNPSIHDPACPKYYDLKEVAKLIDQCPNRPEDFDPGVHDPRCHKVYVMREAYPDANWKTVQLLAERDTDRDGIIDLLDRCPGVKGEAARKGCPSGAAIVRGDMLKTAQPIEFAFNSYRIKSEMMPVILDVAEAMILNPKMIVRIEGYAGPIGPVWANRWLSNARADAVRKELVKAGIPLHRLITHGLGETTRFGTSKTPEGRAKNRRVVFIVVAE